MGGVIGGVTKSGAGLMKMGVGMIQSNQAKKDLKAFKRQELGNFYDGMTPSTMGGQLQMEQAQQNLASTTEALGGAGSRGLSYLTQATGQANQVAKGVAANWDAQQKNIDVKKADGAFRVQDMNEVRENTQLAGLSKNYAQAKQLTMDGFNQSQEGAGEAGAAAGSAVMGG